MINDILDFNVSGVNPSKVFDVGTLVKYFPAPLRVLGSQAGTSPYSQGANSSGNPSKPNRNDATGSLWLPSANLYNGRFFEVRAAGSYGYDVGDPSGTVEIALYVVTNTLLAPGFTKIATTGQVSNFANGVTWMLRATMVGDSASGILQGIYTAMTDGFLENSTPKATAVVGGLDFTNGNTALQQGQAAGPGPVPVCGFVVGVTFGTSDSSNVAFLNQFRIERVPTA